MDKLKEQKEKLVWLDKDAPVKKNNAIISMICVILEWMDIKYNVTQYRWGRRLYKGKWFLIWVRGLPIGMFWSDRQITSCLSETYEIEEW